MTCRFTIRSRVPPPVSLHLQPMLMVCKHLIITIPMLTSSGEVRDQRVSYCSKDMDAICEGLIEIIAQDVVESGRKCVVMFRDIFLDTNVTSQPRYLFNNQVYSTRNLSNKPTSSYGMIDLIA